ncbi:alpha/beta hydrolase [Staphylococcus massiliensis]|uniref:BD-FAE-like domain-containing protein n=1 Tax=Staphylococcus massiliensis S46 TaxID=1229783 RepID=K9AIE7_9STAP|nr:alpha/beta hydrolase [Staphylococcus massiliensis]EKU47108.1 hypothetical protein C273_08386 [Staphylococcus massiliensis S46]MCG3398599.1 alpha/beta hydrolase [Staphylococcus massiliensis]MCG3401164.1 alpha/beta hydrolase [Staphylococcus massiliensis]MCG3412301.1 alpha/beta hydrolase [Staphylococcus massiliensis]
MKASRLITASILVSAPFAVLGFYKFAEKESILARIIQLKDGFTNYRKAKTYEEVIDDKYKIINNVQYDTELPRGFCDIITKNDEGDATRPTFIYMHGGGFVVGDKIEGDPTTNADDAYMKYKFEAMVEYGYNVVTTNYAFAPWYKHPKQVEQISRLVEFLKANAEKFNLNKDEFIISGTSAGGNLAVEFALIQVSETYQQQVGIKPVLNKDNIKALLLEVPLLDPYRSNKTQAPIILNNFLFGRGARAYYYKSVIRKYNPKLDLIRYVDSNFPPVFITDGNAGSFKDQATDFYNKLQEHGVPSDIYVPSFKYGKKTHSYMSDLNSQATKNYHEARHAFLLQQNLVR